MTLLLYFTLLYYHNAPLWMWLMGAVVWVLHAAWHLGCHFDTRKILLRRMWPKIHIDVPSNVNVKDIEDGIARTRESIAKKHREFGK